MSRLLLLRNIEGRNGRAGPYEFAARHDLRLVRRPLRVLAVTRGVLTVRRGVSVGAGRVSWGGACQLGRGVSVGAGRVSWGGACQLGGTVKRTQHVIGWCWQTPSGPIPFNAWCA
eukprot:COSAG01_NODE_373_length_17991_cov_284.890075_17_plen_115_part_00